MKEKKEALIVLGISIPVLCYGAFSFELQGASSNFEAITVAIAVTLGLFGVGTGLLLLFTKTSLGLVKEPKLNRSNDSSKEKRNHLIIKEKEMVKTKEEKPVEKSGSESIGLMQREKELVKRADELTALVNEVEAELIQVIESLETKGWVLADKGWVIE